MDFTFAATTLRDAVLDLPFLNGHYRSAWYLSIAVLGLVGYSFHELGHFVAARFYGLGARLRVLAAYRSPEFRRHHGWLAFLNVMAVDIDALHTRPLRQVRIIAAAGTIFEFGFMFAVCCALFLWLAAHGNHPIGDMGDTVDAVATWVPLQLCASLLGNVTPIGNAMNDGYVVFCTRSWRARASVQSK